MKLLLKINRREKRQQQSNFVRNEALSRLINLRESNILCNFSMKLHYYVFLLLLSARQSTSDEIDGGEDSLKNAKNVLTIIAIVVVGVLIALYVMIRS